MPGDRSRAGLEQKALNALLAEQIQRVSQFSRHSIWLQTKEQPSQNFLGEKGLKTPCQPKSLLLQNRHQLRLYL